MTSFFAMVITGIMGVVYFYNTNVIGVGDDV